LEKISRCDASSGASLRMTVLCSPEVSFVVAS
jgi:hypothetical protein